MKKLINDTLKNKDGIYSRKSVTAFASFNLSWIYEMILPFFGLQTKDYVFQGFLMLCGATLGLTVWDKKKFDKNNNEIE